MTIRAAPGVIYLEDVCPVEDAERLLGLLQEPGNRVDLSKCTRAHSAVVQLLLAPGVELTGPIPQGFLGESVIPALVKNASGEASI